MVSSTSAFPERHFVIGGYPAAPSWASDTQGLIRFANQLLSWQGPRGRTMGLEVPFSATSPWAETSVLVSTPSESRHVITMIPATMTELRTREGYGLASGDKTGRRAAVDDVRSAVDFAHSVNAGSGGNVIAIELQSAPRDPVASVDAFRQSLEDLAGADLGGVRLWIEHCDARIPGQDFEKGFLSLDDEISVIGAQGLGVLVNWGRSAIELRSAERVTEHLGAAMDAGLLRGLMFSGVASASTEFGPPWVDAHLPFRGSLNDDPRGASFDSSLLTAEHAERALRIGHVPELQCVGIKLGVPRGTDDETRLAILRSNVEILADLVDGATRRVTDQDGTRY